MNEKQSINIKFFQRGKVKYESTTLLTLYVRLQGILFAQVLYFGLLSKLDARYKLTYPIVDTAVSRLVSLGNRNKIKSLYKTNTFFISNKSRY